MLSDSGKVGFDGDIFNLSACRLVEAGEWEFDFKEASEVVLEYPFDFILAFVFYGDDFIVPDVFYQVTLAGAGDFSVPVHAADFPDTASLVGDEGFKCGAAGRAVSNPRLAFDSVDGSFPDLDITG